MRNCLNVKCKRFEYSQQREVPIQIIRKSLLRSVENMSYNSRDITLIIRDTVSISCAQN